MDDLIKEIESLQRTYSELSKELHSLYNLEKDLDTEFKNVVYEIEDKERKTKLEKEKLIQLEVECDVLQTELNSNSSLKKQLETQIQELNCSITSHAQSISEVKKSMSKCFNEEYSLKINHRIDVLKRIKEIEVDLQRNSKSSRTVELSSEEQIMLKKARIVIERLKNELKTAQEDNEALESLTICLKV